MFNHLFDGIKLGLHYDDQFKRILIWGAQHQKGDCIHDVVQVAIQNVKETESVLVNPTGLIFNGDPFAESRKMTQDLVAKWGVAAGVH